MTAITIKIETGQICAKTFLHEGSLLLGHNYI